MSEERSIHPVLGKLMGSDRRSIGSANEVAGEIVADEALFSVVFEGILSSNPVLSMRAADAVEKASRERPELLQPHKSRILRELAIVEQQEVRWHVAQMLPRLRLNLEERHAAVDILRGFLDDKSQIVRVHAMQGLADLAVDHAELRKAVVAMLNSSVETGRPAVRARGRKLLEELRK